ncbi:MAG TPA: chorismate lyase [Burkholderiaceae bacterium]|nr:chorismate lyase [Burkholderiaceae bacterium]
MQQNRGVQASRRDWSALPLLVPAGLHRWLLHRDSLTALLRAHCEDLRVCPIVQRFAFACDDERAALGVRARERVWVRQVRLMCDGAPVVFAHSVVSRSGLRRSWRALNALGRRALGDLLFSNPQVHRLPFGFKRLRPGHALWNAAIAALELDAAGLWARRSLFVLRGQRLWVTEVFSPRVLELNRLKSN